MNRFVHALAAITLVALAVAPVGAVRAGTCTALNGTFVGSGGVITIQSSATAKSFSGTMNSKMFGNGTFTGVTTDGATYASGSIDLSTAGNKTFRITVISAGAVDVTIGTTTWKATCG